MPREPDTLNIRLPKQRGAALLVALIFLVALTLLGVASMGNNQLQQRMAYGATQNTIALQAAESALGDGEVWLISRTPTTKPQAACTSPCGNTLFIWPGQPADGTESEVSLANIRTPAWWTDEGRRFGFDYVNNNPGTQVPGQIIPNVVVPRYVIEELGRDPTLPVTAGVATGPELWFYRVTARGTAQAQTPTITQSIFAVRF